MIYDIMHCSDSKGAAGFKANLYRLAKAALP